MARSDQSFYQIKQTSQFYISTYFMGTIESECLVVADTILNIYEEE